MPKALQARTMVGIKPLICTTSGPIVRRIWQNRSMRAGLSCELCSSSVSPGKGKRTDHTVNAIPQAGLLQCITRIGG
jgi:hypothetical protein